MPCMNTRCSNAVQKSWNTTHRVCLSPFRVFAFLSAHVNPVVPRPTWHYLQHHDASWGGKIHDELVLECPACEEDLDRLKARDTRPSLPPSAPNAIRVSEMLILPEPLYALRDGRTAVA